MTSMFTCRWCGVEHSELDTGKKFSDGALCRCCAHGVRNRAERRRAPASDVCRTPCWTRDAIQPSLDVRTVITGTPEHPQREG